MAAQPAREVADRGGGGGGSGGEGLACVAIPSDRVYAWPSAIRRADDDMLDAVKSPSLVLRFASCGGYRLNGH